jgi:hypothetical protein
VSRRVPQSAVAEARERGGYRAEVVFSDYALDEGCRRIPDRAHPPSVPPPCERDVTGGPLRCG